MRRLLGFLTSVLLLTGCGGGGSSPIVDPNAGIIRTNVDGTWFGTMTLPNGSGGSMTVAVSGIITNGDGIFFNGIHAIRLNTFTGEGDTFAVAIQAIESAGLVVHIGEIAGTVRDGHINASWSLDDGSSGALTLDYHPVYEEVTTQAELTGIWSRNSAISLIVSLDERGVGFGQDAAGCTYDVWIRNHDGSVGINSYLTSISIQNCGEFGGAYDGYTVIIKGDPGDPVRLDVSAISINTAPDRSNAFHVSFFKL